DIVEQQMILRRMADVCINIFAMSAVLSRATRSKVDGLRNCDHELMLATAFCSDVYAKSQRLYRDIGLGEKFNGDLTKKKIASDIFETRSYRATHPLTP
ncbi:complex I assembly factor ACAD9, mitochondrial-like, partial [Saccoglossus kowalevskii]|uniref:Acyl-CoA dehydrogenase family member 9, mitochondrial-like n=1 Tax=Saccoglossus kowalevskii TaxID=10224 RepID=A0ABM0MVN3_SACKO